MIERWRRDWIGFERLVRIVWLVESLEESGIQGSNCPLHPSSFIESTYKDSPESLVVGWFREVDCDDLRGWFGLFGWLRVWRSQTSRVPIVPFRHHRYLTKEG